jgi:hypothetical protein
MDLASLHLSNIPNPVTKLARRTRVVNLELFFFVLVEETSFYLV